MIHYLVIHCNLGFNMFYCLQFFFLFLPMLQQPEGKIKAKRKFSLILCMKATVHLDAYALASLHVKVRKTEGKKNTRKIKACMQKPNIISTAPSLEKLGRSCLIPPWNGNPQKTAVHDNAQNT